jgi:D-inositol-3-phosphate glycosyltransferase
MLAENDTGARLLIAGGESEVPDPVRTPEIGRLQALAAGHGIADHVAFGGQRGRRELRNWYSAADIFVTTPWYEPFGITPVEAMAWGTPVIGSRVGGIQFSVADGQTGYLVPPNDAAALAERMASLLSNPDVIQSMSLKAIERVNQHFTWHKIMPEILEACEDVLEGYAARRSAGMRPGRTVTASQGGRRG